MSNETFIDNVSRIDMSNETYIDNVSRINTSKETYIDNVSRIDMSKETYIDDTSSIAIEWVKVDKKWEHPHTAILKQTKGSIICSLHRICCIWYEDAIPNKVTF